MADICYPVLSERKDKKKTKKTKKQQKKRNGSEETQKLPERLRGCFSNSFHLLRHYCCLLLCYISRANVLVFPTAGGETKWGNKP